MKHLGDITTIDWATVPPVDVVTGGSPCQDLSIAGKRAGLAGERSGLYMEQVKCVRELRKADEQRGRTGQLIRPRYMVWENVPGAFSSNGGEDFRAVLEEAAKVADETTVIPRPSSGKWSNSGAVVGDGWSLAWRVHDAQFWGVPQRRRRISLVCDFGGQSAPEILFERKGVSWDSDPCGAAGKEAAGDAGEGAESASGFGETGIGYWQNGIQALRAEGENRPSRPSNVIVGERAISFQERAGKAGGGKGILIQDERTGALSTLNNQPACCLNDQGGAVMNVTYGQAGTLRAQSHGHDPHVYDARGNGDGSIVNTLTGDHQSRVTDYTALVMESGQANATIGLDCSPTLNASHDQPVLCRAVSAINGTESEINGTLQAKSTGGMSLNLQNVCRVGAIVRRLTPLECERLQGYPDGWTDIGDWTDSQGKRHKAADSPRYKALGNSIALPYWYWLLRRISAQYYGPATLGSLFDGIGGFPLCWERINGSGTALWASEIEEFPIAVTKRRFADENADD